MDLFWEMLFAGQQPVGVAVNLLIILLFAIACIDIYRGRRRLLRERVLVKLAAAQLHKPNPDLFDSAVVGHSSEAWSKHLGIPPDTLLGHRVGRALQLRLAGLGSRDVLQQLTSEKLGSYGSLARQIGASLTLLGLLGTVFGLSLALLNIGDTSANIKGVEDLGRLSHALGGTMGGMETAFGCTLVGLLTAIVLSFLNFGLRRSQSVSNTNVTGRPLGRRTGLSPSTAPPGCTQRRFSCRPWSRPGRWLSRPRSSTPLILADVSPMFNRARLSPKTVPNKPKRVSEAPIWRARDPDDPNFSLVNC